MKSGLLCSSCVAARSAVAQPAPTPPQHRSPSRPDQSEQPPQDQPQWASGVQDVTAAETAVPGS